MIMVKAFMETVGKACSTLGLDVVHSNTGNVFFWRRDVPTTRPVGYLDANFDICIVRDDESMGWDAIHYGRNPKIGCLRMSLWKFSEDEILSELAKLIKVAQLGIGGMIEEHESGFRKTLRSVCTKLKLRVNMDNCLNIRFWREEQSVYDSCIGRILRGMYLYKTVKEPNETGGYYAHFTLDIRVAELPDVFDDQFTEERMLNELALLIK